jgi:hypothetical protein
MALNKRALIIGGIIAASLTAATAASVSAAKTKVPDPLPGWGWGDGNHIHIGPPGSVRAASVRADIDENGIFFQFGPWKFSVGRSGVGIEN